MEVRRGAVRRGAVRKGCGQEEVRSAGVRSRSGGQEGMLSGRDGVRKG